MQTPFILYSEQGKNEINEKKVASKLTIDELDLLILEELQGNARRSNKALAEAVDVSPPTMLNRVRSLEERGVITGYHAVVEPGELNRGIEAIVSVRLSPKTPEAVREFIDFVWAMDETVGVTLLTGAVDVQVHISAQDVTSLGDTVLGRLASAPHVADEQTTIILEHRRKHVITAL